MVLAILMFTLWPLTEALVLTLILTMVVFLPAPVVERLGMNNDGWWLELNGERHYVSWRSGSIRRRDYVVLRWSVWPSHCVIIRADSVPATDDFRRLKAALYGVI